MKYLFGMLLTVVLIQLPIHAKGANYYEVSESPFSLDIAGKPGDLVTVKVWDVVESDDLGKIAEDKKVSQLWNLVDFIFPKLPFTYSVNNSQDGGGGSSGGTGVQGSGPGVYWNGENQWDAQSNTGSKHRVAMTVQARIIEEVAHDQFFIKGYRTVIVHGKPKKIFVSGVVRKKDIQEDNSVMSDHLAESVIELNGEPVSDLKPGWIYKVFDTIFF